MPDNNNSAKSHTQFMSGTSPANLALDAGDSSEHVLISDLLQQGFRWLQFPEPMESSFKESYCNDTLEFFKEGPVWFLGMYLVAGVVMFLLSRGMDAGGWPFIYLFSGVVTLMVLSLARFQRFDDFQQLYTSAGVFMILVPIISIAFFLEDANMQKLSFSITTYSFIAMYTLTRLQFLYAAVVNWASVAVTVALVMISDKEVEWGAFNQSFIGANLLGMTICYILEYRERTAFLQSRLIGLEKERLDILSRQLKQISREDALTKLSNQRFFDEILNREWGRSQRDGAVISLVIINIDYFKQYNQVYGHTQGDLVLKKIAQVIKGQARRPGDLAARWGGEEFIVMYPQASVDAMKFVAERILQGIHELNMPHEHSDCSDRVTVSMGIATIVPAPGMAPSELMKAAQRALYQAKQEGRNCWRVFA